MSSDFRYYSDPDEAKRIFDIYLRDLSAFDLITDAKNLIPACSDSTSLEARLDTLITHARGNLSAVSNMPGPPWDADSMGYQSVALRYLEDNR